jgi:hypothetical protein
MEEKIKVMRAYNVSEHRNFMLLHVHAENPLISYNLNPFARNHQPKILLH